MEFDFAMAFGLFLALLLLFGEPTYDSRLFGGMRTNGE